MTPRMVRQHRAPGFRRTAIVALVGALAGVSLSGIADLPRAVHAEVAPPAAGSTPLPLPDSVTFYGRGYGHGVGMSQYGARGRALAGQDAPTILAHYYQGTTLGQIDPATPVRVLVLSRWIATDAHPLEVTGAMAPWTIDGLGTAFPPNARVRLAWSTAMAPAGWRLTVAALDGSLVFDGPAPSETELVIRPGSIDGRLQVVSKATRYNVYRGNLRLVLTPGSSRVSVVDELALDAYLGGVVPVEMPPAWPAAALQAQSVAARSFAARRLHPATSFYDIPDTSASQIYRGVLAEKPQT
ncbi:MAG: hypothetical protein HY262_05540, partial [Chloroflexi bacterium]|nr:hypothetical protein [Chloroflexota bacterium]